MSIYDIQNEHNCLHQDCHFLIQLNVPPILPPPPPTPNQHPNTLQWQGLHFLFPSILKEGNHKTADMCACISPSVCPSVRVSVRAILRDGWMDHS